MSAKTCRCKRSRCFRRGWVDFDDGAHWVAPIYLNGICAIFVMMFRLGLRRLRYLISARWFVVFLASLSANHFGTDRCASSRCPADLSFGCRRRSAFNLLKVRRLGRLCLPRFIRLSCAMYGGSLSVALGLITSMSGGMDFNSSREDVSYS